MILAHLFLTLSCDHGKQSSQGSESGTAAVDGRINPAGQARANSFGYWQSMHNVSLKYNIPLKNPHDLFEVNMQRAQVVRLTRKVRLRGVGEAVVTPPWNLEGDHRWRIQIGKETYGILPIKKGSELDAKNVDIIYEDDKGVKKQFDVDDPQINEQVRHLVSYLEQIAKADPGGIAPSLREAFQQLYTNIEAN